MANGHRADPAQLLAPLRWVESGGHPLTPGSRAQPCEVDDVGLRGQLASTRNRGGGIGLVHRIDQHDLREVQERVDRFLMPMGRPGDGCDVAHHERVDDRVELLQVARADVEQDALSGERDLPRLVTGLALGGQSH